MSDSICTFLIQRVWYICDSFIVYRNTRLKAKLPCDDNLYSIALHLQSCGRRSLFTISFKKIYSTFDYSTFLPSKSCFCGSPVSAVLFCMFNKLRPIKAPKLHLSRLCQCMLFSLHKKDMCFSLWEFPFHWSLLRMNQSSRCHLVHPPQVQTAGYPLTESRKQTMGAPHTGQISVP